MSSPERIVIKEPDELDSQSHIASMCGEEEEESATTGWKGYKFDAETDKYMTAMMAIGTSDRKKLLERVVGNVTQNIWNKSHIGPKDEDVGQGCGDGSMEEEYDVNEVENVNPDSLELDM